MPEQELRILRKLFLDTADMLARTEQTRFKRESLAEAVRLIDEVIRELKTGNDRSIVHEKVYRIMLLGGEGGAFGKPP